MASKDTIPVYIRIRPTHNFASGNIKINNSTSLSLNIPPTGGSNNTKQSYTFQFNKVLPMEVSQEEIFNEACFPLIENALKGFNSTFFAYGQTGAGKTYTICGPDSSYQQRGMIPRTIESVFHQIHSQSEKSFVVRISFLEIYNEHIYDLLNLDENADLQILEGDRGVFVRNLKEEIVENEEEAMSLYFEGEANRSICEHKLNTASSRSHCIFTIHLESRSRVESEGKTIFSKISLVDMAGSERVSKTGSSGQVLQEAKYINKSLSFLEQVVLALSSSNRDHIPYRQSKLTSLLRDGIGGNSITAMIANIWGEAAHLEETSSTLHFASRIMRVHNKAIQNVHMSSEALIRQYEKQIRELKQELAMHDQLKGVNQVTYEPYTEEQKIQLRENCLRFVNGDVEELEIKNIRHITETFNQFKTIILNLRSDLQNAPSVNPSSNPQGNTVSSTPEVAKGGVGETQEKDGFSVGKAQPNAMFAGKAKQRKNEAAKQSETSQGVAESDSPAVADASGSAERMPRDHAYEKFKITEGKEVYNILKQNIEQYNKKKSEYKDIGKQINEIKKEIDGLKDKLDKKQLSKSFQQSGDIVDQEELLLINSLGDAKKEYRAAYDQRKLIKNEIDYTNNLIDKARSRLMEEFDVWYTQTFGPEEEETREEASTGNEVLDDGEKFDKLQREQLDDPSSVSYFNARKRAQLKKARR